MDTTNTLTVGESVPLVLTKRVKDEEKQSPRVEGSPKQTRVTKGSASREITPFIKISNVLSS